MVDGGVMVLGAEEDDSPQRPLGAGSARSLLLTVLGELVLPGAEPVWTSSLLYVLTGLGLEQQTARQAIARGAAAGWLAGEKHGREVRWTLADSGLELIEDGRRRVCSLNGPDDPWDGDWLILLVTIPQRRKAVRKRLYTALSWAGFGNPTAGVWVSPHLDRAAEAQRIVDEVELRDSTIGFVGPALSAGLPEVEMVRRAWDLDEIARRYQELIDRYAPLRPAPGDETLFTHIAMANEWQRFPFLDPQLPERLLPGWIGRRAAAVFVELRESWLPGARDRWRELARAVPALNQG